jgi:hypothetical protein
MDRRADHLACGALSLSGEAGTIITHKRCRGDPAQELTMGRYLLLWLLGVPIPILILIWAFGGLN